MTAAQTYAALRAAFMATHDAQFAADDKPAAEPPVTEEAMAAADEMAEASEVLL